MSPLVSTTGVNAEVDGFADGRAGARETRNRRSSGGGTAALIGAPVGIRTPNLLIRSQMLYPLSYRRPSVRTAQC